MGQDSTTRCIACAGSAHEIGEVPYSDHFLQHRFRCLETGDLYECSDCGLWFKHPYLSDERIAELYKTSPASLSWDGSVARPDFARAVSAISEAFEDGGTVLDLGCYKGEFLRSLPDRFVKQGIEPSTAGAEAAKQHGVEMLGADLSGLGNRQFDAITLFDVFEHLTAPLVTLDTLFAHLRPNGLLCIGTGFADSFLFRQTGSKYNYVCMPEHVCFLTKRFLDFLCDRYQAECQFSAINKEGWNLRRALRAAAIDCVNLPILLLRTRRAIHKWYLVDRLRVIAGRGFIPLSRAGDHALIVLRRGDATKTQDSTGPAHTEGRA